MKYNYLMTCIASAINSFRYYLLCLLMLMTIDSFGQPRSEDEALVVAQQFLQLRMPKRPNLSVVYLQDQKMLVTDKKLSPSKNLPSHQGFFIFNNKSDDGFVIISADLRQHSVLGYSPKGTFDVNSIPVGLKDLLLQYNDEYLSLQAHVKEAILPSATKTAAVEPLIQTQWGQGSPYNGKCPIDPSTGNVCAAGCDAVALAQILNYHRYPKQGVGSHAYTTDSLHIEQVIDFSTCSFDWDNMPDLCNQDSPEEQKEAVALLMHACGVALDMDYLDRGSRSIPYKVAFALRTYFSFSRNIKYYQRSYFTDEQWEGMIHADLNRGLPIFYRGSMRGEDGSSQGRGFVLDGCDEDGNYHINWCSYGVNDGYFKLSSLIVGNSDYSSNQGMTCHIIPSPKDTQWTQIGDGSMDSPYNAGAANAFAQSLDVDSVSSHPVFIQGKVAAIKENYNVRYGNATFLLSDDGSLDETFEVYRAWYLGNMKYAAGPTLNIGDEVVVCAYVKNYSGALFETDASKGYLVSVNGRFLTDFMKGDGTKEDPYNCISANLKASQLKVGETSSDSCYVVGVISSINEAFGSQYGNATFYISDDGTEESQFYIYRGLYLENKKWVEGNPQISVGDTVVVHGLMTNYRGTYEMTRGYIYSQNGNLSIPEPQLYAEGDGTLDNPFNCIAAKAKATELQVDETSAESYYVKGFISSIRYYFTEDYGTAAFYIADDMTGQNTFSIYRSNYLENFKWVEGFPQIAVGDEVIVYGRFTNYKGTYEMNGGYLYSHNGNITTSITKLQEQELGQTTIYTPSGLKVSKLQRGIIFCLKPDGTIQKVLVK